MLISLHLPKCGGRSFASILRGVYKETLYLDYQRQPATDISPCIAIGSHIRCIHGHFKAGKYDYSFDQKTMITWVRHPLQRVVSHYYFFLRRPQNPNPLCVALHENKLSLLEFAALKGVPNRMSSFLATKRVDDFDAVGITEFYAESLRQIHRVVPEIPVDVAIPYENFNEERGGEVYRISKQDEQRILELNQRDLAWYEEALARFHKTKSN